MPTTFTDCDKGVHDIAVALMGKYYRDLADADVTIRYLFASNPDAIGGALKHNGYPAAATVKVNSLKDRVEGKTDCAITIDKKWWDAHDQRACAALIDHELYHILIAYDDEGELITDDAGRPKVKLRPHDFQIGGFHVIAERHGPHAEEVVAILGTQAKWVQMGLQFEPWG